MTVNYEEFCTNPKATYDCLCEKLQGNGFSVEQAYNGEKSFEVTRSKVNDKKIADAFSVFYK